MSQAVTLPSRRERFRALIERLDATASPQRALDDGLCLERPDGVPQRIATSLELRPRGTHLVVGSVGSGKTTALLEVQRRLQQIEPGWLVSYHDAGGRAPEPMGLLGMLSVGRRAKILLIDGFDRTTDLEGFRAMIAADLPRLGDCGVVCVGPPQLLVDAPSLERDWFERIEICGALDLSSPEARVFLERVLAHRSDEALEPDIRALIALGSGGILRDLLLLARSAVEETYAAGGEHVDMEHVARAIQRMSTSLLRAVDPYTWKFLLGLLPEGWQPATAPALVFAKDMVDLAMARELVLHRLLIPLPGVPQRYIFHPCIVPRLGLA
jgi:hypothetical protein